MKDYITLAAFDNPHQYAILKTILEREQIQFFFQNETVIGLIPFYSTALGGILLKVHPKDVQAAKKILDELNHNSHLRIV